MYVGIADLQNQLHRYAAKIGFRMNILLIGEPSLGKSMFMNTLFKKGFVMKKNASEDPANESKEGENLYLETYKYFGEEKDVRLEMNVTITRNYGIALDTTNSWREINSFIDKGYVEEMKMEHSLHRDLSHPDPRIHCCFFFFTPSNHKLKPVDILTMQKIHHKVNLIPILARAESFTVKEKSIVKTNVLKQLDQFNIATYPRSDYKYAVDISKYMSAIPFSVITGQDVYEKHGKQILCRDCTFGKLEVFDSSISEFTLLRDFVMKICMYDLIDSTNTVLYNRFRSAYLSQCDLTDSRNFKDHAVGKDLEQEKKYIEEQAEVLRQELIRKNEETLMAETYLLEQMKLKFQAELDSIKERIDQENKK